MPILRLFDRQTRHLATQRAIADDPCFLHYYRIFRLRPRIFLPPAPSPCKQWLQLCIFHLCPTWNISWQDRAFGDPSRILALV